MRVTSGAGGVSTPYALAGTPRTPPPNAAAAAAVPAHGDVAAAQPAPPPTSRHARFTRLLSAPVVDLAALREASWSGVPAELRPAVWRLLCAYAHPAQHQRQQQLARKRADYRSLVAQHHAVPASQLSEEEATTLRQIRLDLPRTSPQAAWVHTPQVQAALERLLFVRAVRSSAAGYVQGLSDLAVPFLSVFLSEAGTSPSASTSGLHSAEADAYYCLCHLLDAVQDHYTFAQPGIQRKAHALAMLIARLDSPLHAHLVSQGCDYLVFSFRWLNCLLQREVPEALVPRLFDTYLAEGDGFAAFVLYVAAAFLCLWRDQLVGLEFSQLVQFLQQLPTHGWTDAHVGELLGRAHQWRVTFADAGSHLLQRG